MITDYKGYRITVQYETDPLNPREWDNFGTMVCFHNKYKLGDVHDFNKDDYNSWDEVRDAIKERGGVIILPLGLYDHSGITMYIGDQHDRWDGGQVGFIYCTAEDMTKEGPYSFEQAEALLRGEVRAYDKYLVGDICEYRIEENRQACSCGECMEWQIIDSCGGWNTSDEALDEAKAIVDSYNKVYTHTQEIKEG